MSNEQYLIVSYFAIGLAAFGTAVVTYLWIRRSFQGVADAVPSRPLGVILKRLFLIGILLPAMMGFFSVSFRSCGKDTYAKIIADRAYLEHVNRQQAKATLDCTIIALVVWGLVLLVPLLIIKKNATKGGS